MESILLDSRSTIALNHDFYLDRGEEVGKGTKSSHYFLINPESGQKILISEEEAFIWLSLKQNNDVKETMYKFVQTFSKIDFELFEEVMAKWESTGVLLEVKTNVHVLEKQRINILSSFKKLINSKFESKLAVTTINNFSQRIPNIFKRTITNVVLSIISIISLILIAKAIHDNSVSTSHFVIDFGNLAILGYVIPMIVLGFHEIGHGIGLTSIGLHVKKAGFRLYYGIPVFFVDTSDAWLKAAKKRIIVSISGPLINLYFAGSSALVILLNIQIIPTEYLLYFIAINMFSLMTNLLPFLEFDGYFLLIDSIDQPGLKTESFQVYKKLIHREELSIKDFGLLLFSILWSVSLIVILGYTLYTILMLVS